MARKQLAMHTLASRTRMSEREPKWFLFATSSYAFGRRNSRFATLNVNKVNLFYFIVLILVASCMLFL